VLFLDSPPPSSRSAIRRKFDLTLLAAKHLMRYMSHSLSMRVFNEYPTLKGDIGLSGREILALVVHMLNFKALHTEASQHPQIAKITTAGFQPT
jgi:hypothetical protein